MILLPGFALYCGAHTTDLPLLPAESHRRSEGNAYDEGRPIATAQNGWHAVVGGERVKQVGWISALCSRIEEVEFTYSEP